MTTGTEQPNSTLIGGAGSSDAQDGGVAKSGNDWLTGVPDDLRTAIAAKNFDGVPSLIKSYIHLERKSGAEGDQLILPGKDAKPEDWKKWDGWKRLGRPDDPNGYGFKAPEGLPDGVFDPKAGEKWAQRFHEAGLSATQASALFNAVVEDFKGQLQTQESNASSGAEKAKAELKKVYGDQYDAQIDRANRAFKQAFGNDLKTATSLRMADGTFLGDNPLVIKAFATLGALFGEDGALPGGGSSAPSNAETELATFMQDPENVKALANRSHPNRQATLDKWNALQDKIAGN